MGLTETYFEKIQSEFRFSAAKSGGPGGQHVNKTETKVILRWKFQESEATSSIRKTLISKKLESLINSGGEIVVSSDQFKSRKRNKEDCVEKLRKKLKAAFYVKPTRKKTRISKSTKLKNRQKRQEHSEKKNLRKKVKY